MTLTDDFNYELPPEQIAQFPLACRTDARLLVVDRGKQALTHAHVRDLADFVRPADALVVNDTRVIPARLAGYRMRTKGRWEGLFLSVSDEGLWRILGKTRGRLQPGESVMLQDRLRRDVARLDMLASLGGGEWAARPDSNESAWTLLERVGRVPLPGYIRGGKMVDSDVATYQTVFAAKPGAVAAPTAGLHFTDDLLRQIELRGTLVGRVTLHVGLGTFRPITTRTLEEHVMHSEWGSLDAPTAEKLRARRAAGGRVIAVGTTVVRTLESAAADGQLRAWHGETNLFIRPPYACRSVDALLTNFHLPRSTLLVLVRTFGGNQLIRHAYETAIREGYRFYSYGDAMLIV
jgi:S-adenosylmethionine:tRNA ribosyltransferase-isomerase